MYDNKILDHYIEHPEEIRWSKKWLQHHLDCTPEGRKRCGGECCTKHVNRETEHRIHVQYYNKEWNLIPKHVKKELQPFLTKDRIVKNVNGECSLISKCLEYPKYKPRECKLSPLVFNKKGKLGLSYQKICCVPPKYDTYRCPNYKKGPEVWVAMKDNLIDLFGKDVYDRIKKDMEEQK
jgi:hypothetical protein